MSIMSKCTNDLSKRVILNLHDHLFFYWNNVCQEVLRFMCIHELVCVCLFIPKHSMKINSESKICSLLPSVILKNTPQIAQLLVPQFSRKSSPWKMISVQMCVFVCGVLNVSL